MCECCVMNPATCELRGFKICADCFVAAEQEFREDQIEARVKSAA